MFVNDEREVSFWVNCVSKAIVVLCCVVFVFVFVFVFVL